MRGIGAAVIVLVATCSVLASGGAFAYEASDVKSSGTIEGRVVFSGSLPAPKVYQIAQDREVCGKTLEIHEIEGKNGGLKNAVVKLVEVKKGKKFDLPEAVLDQRGCVFTPHIVLMAPGKLTIVNSDPVSHNVHTDPGKNDPINVVLSKLKRKTSVPLELPDLVPVKCDQHGLMSAFVVVAEHPYYAVTGETGIFRLRDVPPGTYTVEVWHEKLGRQQGKVTVEAGKTAAAELTFKK